MDRIIKLLLVACLACSLLILSFLFFVPVIIVDYILPDILHTAGVKDYIANIYHLDANGAALSFVMDDGNESLLSLPAVRIEWNLSGLMNGEIEKVSLIAPSISCNINDSEMQLAGFNIVSDSSKKSDENHFTAITLPIKVNRFEILNGKLLFSHNSEIMPLFFSFHAAPLFEKSNHDKTYTISFLHGSFFIDMNGLNIRQKFDFVPETSLLHLHGSIKNACFPCSLRQRQQLEDVMFRGCMDIKSEMRATLAPFAVNSLELYGKFTDFFVKGNGWIASVEDNKLPSLTISGGNGLFQYDAGPFHLSAPLDLTLNATGTLNPMIADSRMRGMVADSILKIAIQDFHPMHEPPNFILEPSPLTLNVSSKLNVNEKWTWNFEGKISGTDQKNSKIDLLCKKIHASMDLPVIAVHGSGEKEKGNVELLVDMKDINLLLGNQSLMLEDLSFSGKMEYGKKTLLNNELTIGAGSFADKQHSFEVKNILLSVPWLLHDEDGTSDNKKGGFSCDRLLYQGVNIGSFKADIIQKGAGAISIGKLHSPLIEDADIIIKTNVTSFINTPAYNVDVSIENGRFSSDKFAIFIPELEKWNASGVADIQLSFMQQGCNTATSTVVKLDDISLNSQDGMFHLDGGRLGLALRDIHEPYSLPSQTFTFDSAKLGRLKTENGKISFRINALDDLTIENMALNWCGGTVYGSNIHIQPGISDYSATLFCQHLQFAEILNLFENVNAYGDGTLNGRLPLSFSSGRLRIDNGLLISAPGETGVVKLDGASLLSSGLGGDSGSASGGYLEFAARSLENFKYDWARLDISSDDDILDIKLKISGRSASPLPFHYDTNGMIVEFDGSNNAKGITHPLQLDVNFSIPIDKMLRYGVKWQQLN